MLVIENLKVSYGRIEALHGVNVEIDQGNIVSIIGSNGAGKTTLLNAVSGMVRYSGKVFFNGKALPVRPNRVVKAGIVHVPEGRKIFSGLTVEENLRIGGYLNRSRVSLNRMIDEQYDIFPILGERRKQDAGMLSGGEQQMLAISRALLGRPAMLLMDEPSLGLAPKIIDEVFRIISSIREKGITILLVEQNAVKALQASDYGFVLENGRVTHTGRGKELLGDERILEAYLGKRKNRVNGKQLSERGVQT